MKQHEKQVWVEVMKIAAILTPCVLLGAFLAFAGHHGLASLAAAFKSLTF